MTSNNFRPAPLDVRLFFYWENVPPGMGVTMRDMMSAMAVTDPQAIRSSLVRLRRGRVPHPTEPGHLRVKPVRWNSRDRRYYDLSRVTPDAVAAQVPGSILTTAFATLLTRAATLDSSMGEEGLVRSAQQLLDDDDTRRLIAQLPLPTIWQVHATVLRIAQARQLFELNAAGGGLPLPEG